jgi:anti-sigma factor RsiW
MTVQPEMSCRELVELVTDYLEDALDPVTRQRFEQHLQVCDGCVAYVDQMRTTVRLLGEVPEESLSPEVRDRLLAAFRGWRRDA